ncbi:hypothetical protein B0H15DRAFT_627649 [Mycena belliarum]|uniref:Uncharacterized protein n=1 Tax=Mycena belliarum TaxID=1033014 RepID=A0AAD6XYT3_9AGAR|nr:hypothetical protein B0H15DRAFT_627649 [Mycena belliae]
MPSFGSRTCGLFKHIFMWFARMTAALARRPAANELPLYTLDPDAAYHIGETLSVPEDAAESERLVLSRPWQRGHGLHRHADEVASERRSSTLSSEACNSQLDTSKAGEFASLFSVSPVLLSQSPVASITSTPLVHMSPPTTLQSPDVCTSLLNPVHDFGGPATTPVAAIGELGKRRGFKGAPLITPDTAKKSSISFLSLSSAFSPKFPISPRPSPSTPRTPLSTVTNRIRSSTARSPAKPSAKPSAMKTEPPIPQQLQHSYDLGDPFSVIGASFFIPQTISATVPLRNLESLDVYRATTPRTALFRAHKNKAFEGASRRSCKGETNIYDLMVYNFQPKAKSSKSKVAFPRSHASFPFTMACLPFLSAEPRVCLPRYIRQNSDNLDDNPPYPVPFDFCRNLRPLRFLDSQQALVNIRPEHKAVSCTPPSDNSSSRYCSDTLTTASALSTRRPSSALDDLLALLDVGVGSSNRRLDNGGEL